MRSFDDLKNVVAAAQDDADKFDKGNAAAGKRLRMKMQTIKGLATDIRKEVQQTKNAQKGIS